MAFVHMRGPGFVKPGTAALVLAATFLVAVTGGPERDNPRADGASAVDRAQVAALEKARHTGKREIRFSLGGESKQEVTAPPAPGRASDENRCMGRC